MHEIQGLCFSTHLELDAMPLKGQRYCDERPGLHSLLLDSSTERGWQHVRADMNESLKRLPVTPQGLVTWDPSVRRTDDTALALSALIEDFSSAISSHHEHTGSCSVDALRAGCE